MAKEKRIVAVLYAGLGNRMRVLASCIQKAKKENRHLYIVWPKNAALGCEFQDLFAGLSIQYTRVKGIRHFLYTQIFRHGAIRRFFRIYKTLGRLLSVSTLFDDDLKENKTMVGPANHSTMLVATCFAFDSDLNMQDLSFSQSLISKANNVYAEFESSYVGVHLRRTDHTDIIALSPVERYTTLMDKYIEINSSQKFFIATDDQVTKDYLKERYSSRILVFNSKLGRGSLAEIEDGVIELLLLSKSDSIICSKLSSYSDTAISIGGIRQVSFV